MRINLRFHNAIPDTQLRYRVQSSAADADRIAVRLRARPRQRQPQQTQTQSEMCDGRRRSNQLCMRRRVVATFLHMNSIHMLPPPPPPPPACWRWPFHCILLYKLFIHYAAQPVGNAICNDMIKFTINLLLGMLVPEKANGASKWCFMPCSVEPQSQLSNTTTTVSSISTLPSSLHQTRCQLKNHRNFTLLKICATRAQTARSLFDIALLPTPPTTGDSSVCKIAYAVPSGCRRRHSNYRSSLHRHTHTVYHSPMKVKPHNDSKSKA